MLAAVPTTYRVCDHGRQCMRCLAASVLWALFTLPLHYSIDLAEEAWLWQLGQLADNHLFAVTVAQEARMRMKAARNISLAVQAPHVHMCATAGCGKTTVLNVVG